MAEFNPYKLEEEKWTPNNVYEILPPNAVSWSDYEFGQGTDNVDKEAANKSLIDGFVDFFKELFGTAGQILGGAIELGGAILGGFVNGVIGLIGGIAKAIGSIFGGGSSESPNLPLFNPIKTNLEAAIKPHRDKINESWQKTEEILAEQEVLRGQMSESLQDMREARDRADEAIEKSGQSIAEAQAASAAAETARQTLEAYNTALNQRITTEFKSAMSKAEEAISQAETANSELVAMNTQLGAITQQASDLNTKLEQHNQKFTNGLATANTAIDAAVAATAAVKTLADENKAKVASAISKADKANADLALLSPKVTDAVDKAGKASSAVTALTTRVSTAEGKVATAEQNVAALTPKVTDAVSKSNKAAADVATLTPKVTAASDKATQAASDVADLTPKVTAAQNKADKAASDLTTLTPKVTAAQTRADAAYTEAGKVRTDLTPKITAAQTKADTAVADLTKLEPKVTAAQSRADSAYTEAGKVRTEVTPKIEAAQTKGESALAVADTAVDWLKNPTEIGSSVIAVNPETKRPYYADPLTLVDGNPPGTSGPTYMSPASMTGKGTYGPQVPVDPKIKYTVSFWAKAGVAGSKLYGQFRTQEGRNVAPDGTPMSTGAVSVSNPPQPSNKNEDGQYVHNSARNSYFIQALEIPTTWTYYEHEIQFSEGVSSVSISSMYWSHSSGVAADQYISGLDIRPQIPTQAEVDKAQNDAIRANSEILRQQGEINEAQATANLAQKNFNDNQQKWNTASTNATKANTELLKHQGLINDAQAAANLAQKNFNDNQTKWNLASTNATKALADAAKAQTDINAEQTKFNTFQTQFNKDQTKWNTASTNATKALADSTSALSKIATEQSKLNALQSDFNTKQTKWNAAVDRSLATQKTVNDNFKKWSDGAATAIEANTKAIALLSNPQAGASLVVTDPVTKRPNWAEKLEPATAAENPNNLPDAYKAVPNTGSNTAKDMWVNIDPTTEYVVSLWAKANKTGSNMTYDIRDQDGLLAFVRSRDVEGFPNTQDNSRPYWIKGVPTKWTQYKAVFTPRATSRKVRFGSAYFNHSAGTTTDATQFVADFQIYPHVPSQAQVDDAQNQAIKANKDLLVEQGRINAEQKKLNDLDKAFKIEQGKINDKQTGISALNTEMGKANKAATEALAKILGINIGGRNLIKESLFQKSTSDYLIHRFPLGDAKPQNGEEVTFSIKVKPGEGNTRFRLYNSNGNGSSALFDIFLDEQEPSSDGVYKATGKWKVAGGNTHLNVYAYPSSVKTPNLVEWVKLERGNTATDWSLAPEEIPSQAVVDELQDNAIRKNTAVGTENKNAIQALREGLDAAIELGQANIDIEELQAALAAEEKKRDKLQEKVDNLQNEMIPRTIMSGDRVMYDDYVEISGKKVTAKGSWAGQMAVTYRVVSGNGSNSSPYVYDTDMTRKSIPDGTTRSWTLGGTVRRVDYWVYQGRQRTILLANAGPYISGSTYSSGTWGVLATHKAGKTYGTGKIEWRADLLGADRGTTYRFKIQVNGTDIKSYEWKNIGPLTGLGSGKKTLRFEHEFNLPDDATVRVLGYAYNGGTKQARVSLLQGTLVYVQDTAREAQ